MVEVQLALLTVALRAFLWLAFCIITFF